MAYFGDQSVSWLGQRQKKKNRRVTDEVAFDWRLLRGALGSLFGLVVTAGIAFGLWSYAMNPNTLPLQKVQLDAPFDHLSAEVLQGVIQDNAAGGFFSVDVDAVTHALTQLPWVASVTVRRVWPDTLHVVVVEQKPLALWVGGGVISQEGKLFFPDDVTALKGLPQLSGPDFSVALVAQRYRQLSQQLGREGIELLGMTLTPRRAWELVLANGVNVMLGSEETAVRLQRFVRFYPGLAPLAENIERVDMRYPNGFVVAWRDPGAVWG